MVSLFYAEQLILQNFSTDMYEGFVNAAKEVVVYLRGADNCDRPLQWRL
jgi:hypothetical protein